MLRELQAFYKKNGILSTSFTCPFKSDCKGDSKSFTGPKSAFVSTGYENALLPRLLFLSLDSGSGDTIDANRLPRAVRKKLERDIDVLSLPQHKHWYRTHELAWYILRRFDRDLKIEDTRKYFAHTNSAKCCMNKAGRKKADRLLFKNCRPYLTEELSILEPDIIVTQGNEARKAIRTLSEGTLKQFDKFASIIQFNSREIFWLHTYHPSNYGLFYKQRDFDDKKNTARGWDRYSKMIHRFITTNARTRKRTRTVP